MKHAFILGLGAMLVIALIGCGHAAVTAESTSTSEAGAVDDAKAVAMLKHSMDIYAAMPSLTADCAIKMNFDGESPADTRTIAYEKPNRFKIVSSSESGMVQTSISDGKGELEFDNMTGQDPRQAPAPDTIADAKSMQMMHPMFCGTLLYQFFGGSANYDNLVDSTKGPVTFGAEEESASGENSRIVKFYGQQQYGHVEALIGEKTGHVYRIKYDSEPLVKMMQDPKTMEQMKDATTAAAKTLKASAKTADEKAKIDSAVSAAAASAPKVTGYTTEENYSKIATPATITPDTFAVIAPKGTKPIAFGGDEPIGKPPVPLGSEAPDFTVTNLDGKSVKLSSLRGHPVMLDFWATWCGPCVASLTHTQEIYAKGKAAGLQVYAISDEDKATVSKFITDNKYTFPTALDTTKAAGEAYKTEAIPTTVVIDSSGKLVAYIVGGGNDSKIAVALGQVGITLH